MLYDDKFEYAVKVDEQLDTEEVVIPPMLIQPFIENAIQHGFHQKEDVGHVTVRFILIGKKIVCEVEDDGIGRERSWETTYQRKKSHKSPSHSNL